MEQLSRDECLRLLSSQRLGRIGFHAGALPVVLPMSFAVGRRGIVVRAARGSQADTAIRGAVVAFEVDDVDPARGTAWSVAVTGTAREITDPDDLAEARALSLDRWGPADGDRLVCISLDVVTGRRGPTGQPPAPAPEPAWAASGPAAVAETHSGVVVLVGDRAYKMKKPLDLGFLDFRTRESRLAACRREVALNRRLAPDVYLGVADVTGPDGDLCDHLVVMRRMPDDRRLSTLVAAGGPVEGHLDRLAVLLAGFHAGAASSPAVDEAATSDADAARWEANAAEMEPFAGGLLDPAAVAEVRARAARFLAGRRPLFDRRIADGRARDGHGDLLADDIFCLDDGPRVLDCLEFDDRLRHGDTLSDAAFLAMDLERLGRPDLAGAFLDRYRRAAGDDWPPALAHHYVAYRAQVRAKVACIRRSQGDAGSAQVAADLLARCLCHLRRAAVRLVLVGGLPGTGKSTVARALAPRLDAVLLRSDEVRKELAGLPPGTPVPAAPGEGLYSPAATEAAYAALLDRARRHLGMGRTVVLDATWRDGRWRDAARAVAAEAVADVVALRCTAPLEVAAARAGRRRAAGGDPSDAGEEVVRALGAGDGPWPGWADVDTSGDTDAAVRAAAALFPDGADGDRRGDLRP